MVLGRTGCSQVEHSGCVNEDVTSTKDPPTGSGVKGRGGFEVDTELS